MDITRQVRRASAAVGLHRYVRRTWAHVRFGDLRRIEPVSSWGGRRGTPVDRWYIERYLAERANDVHGHALEVKDDLYSSRFGAVSVDILDIDADNPLATVVGDVCEPGTLAPSNYDVAIVTQTLQLVPAPQLAIRNLISALRPAGTLLVTAPALSRIVDGSDRWRWTPAGMQQVLTAEAPGDAQVEVTGLGNSLTARAFLFGLAVQDLAEDVLAITDEAYPMVVGGRVSLPR